MSLLGRLEDLSLTDIVQIVFLSRRTGVLEIIDDRGRHTVLFRQGLVVNASSPEYPDLVAYLEKKGLANANQAVSLRRMDESGVPFGTAAVEMNILSIEDLANAIRERIVEVVAPLMESREGEFNFLLSDSMTVLDVEYDPDAIFKEGGLAPQKILGGTEGEKLKPLKGLEESLKAGKALLRSSAPAGPASLDLGLGQPGVTAPASARSFPPPPMEPAPAPIRNEEPFPDAEPAPVPPQPPAAQSPAAGHFKVAGGLFAIETPEAQFRNVVLYERDPLVRVAAKRAFARRNVKIFQYGSLEDVRTSMTELFRSNSFFVTFLELGEEDASSDGPSVRLMQQLKGRNPRLPVVLVDPLTDLRRRHDVLRAGADLYLTKPTPARLQPGLAEEELSLFADELVLFAERAFEQWEQMTGTYGVEAGKKFYELASKDSVDRSFGLLKQLINELSNPNDIGEVSATILRLAAQYIDRGALFVLNDEEFVGLGGFGVTAAGDEMALRVKRIRIPRAAQSILADVAAADAAHRGKMRKTPANVDLINRMGGLLPSEVVALPIAHGGRTIGILYGDNAENHGPIDNVTGLEIFLSQAGYAFGNAVFASERARS
jgi:CheY-like chemotaxis protein